ncbi:MAG: UbiA prenyltransferase family protein [Candidatus Brockarchaeota archaeon]|nr:UbiA prenyltransferase family protein [Candidatus Brockarchaeota archaeon]
MAKIKDFLVEARILDWYKNLLILLAPFFGGKLLLPVYYPSLLSGFLALSATSSACYVINDIKDAAKDAYHPRKKHRPVASGEMSRASALIFSIILLVFSLLVSYQVSIPFLILCISLFLNSITYTFFLRDIAWLDLLSISLNYIIRSLAGGEIVKVYVSPWLLIGVFYVSMLFVLSKRREELTALNKPEHHRKSFKQYDAALLDQAITIFSALIIISYSLYTFHSPYADGLLPFTIPIITLIVLQFISILRKTEETGIIRRLLSSRIIVTSLLIWLAIMFYLIYLT